MFQAIDSLHTCTANRGAFFDTLGMDKRKGFLPLGIMLIFCITLALFINVLYQMDVVYTHFFYIPIILAGVWYYRKAVYLALALGLLHVLANFIVQGAVAPAALSRSLIFVLVALVVGTLSMKRDILYCELRKSEERIRNQYETLRYNHEDLRKREEEISRLDRLHLIGEISAGIAHEIRNPLTTVRGFLQLLEGKEKYAEDREFLNLMIRELDRSNAIITEFLNLAKNKAVQLKKCSLNEIVVSLYPLIQANAAMSDINVVLCLKGDTDLLLDEKEIRRLIMNLALNGVEAMGPGGTLTIGTAVEDGRVLLYFKDEGPGISEEVRDQIGTPFITTKENAIGLGLAVCYSIAGRNNASISFKTSNEGTTFIVEFRNNNR